MTNLILILALASGIAFTNGSVYRGGEIKTYETF